MNMNITPKELLKRIEAKIVEDKITPELAAQATQLVFGSGDPAANIMFIGEAPGKKEDESGEPFVGAAGRVLDELLNSINMKRSSVYITNIVKYRPPNNRDPTQAEKDAFWPYLLHQIEVVRPRVIATLGRHSGERFIPGIRISLMHGQPNHVRLSILSGGKKDFDVIVVPLYHPAAALYNPGLRQELFKDIQEVSQLSKLQ